MTNMAERRTHGELCKSSIPVVYIGGKSQAAPAVWAALGDVEHYVEPFCGSMAVVLNRPHLANRPYHSETVNDVDGLLINAWRAIQLHPEETAEHASNPVAEADLHARHLALVRWRREHELEHLMGDPTWCDPEMAGWWLWGISCWIGSGWCSGNGPWVLGEDDRLVKREKGSSEPGVERNRPQLGDDGQGVNRPQLREPGVKKALPHLTDHGRGVNHAGLREPGVEYHPVTMPKLIKWFQYLSARLRHVRILNGDWKRTVTTGATLTVNVRMGDGHCGVFLDPPYADTAGRDENLYTHDDLKVAHDTHDWCLENGGNPKYRIVLAGFESEHSNALTDVGWTEAEWFKDGFLTGGMGKKHQQHRERLWMSPHCLTASRQESLF